MKELESVEGNKTNDVKTMFAELGVNKA
nr:hypothetical protein [Parashewanella curva]